MPFPRSQLDLIIVFQGTQFNVAFDSMEELRNRFVHNKWMDANTITQFGKRELNVGKNVSLRFEIDQKHRLYANHQGGYRVFCPNCKTIITRGFSSGVTTWREFGGLPSEHLIQCVHCDSENSLQECVGRPEFAFGMAALHLVNVDTSQIPNLIIEILEELKISYRAILKRVG